MEINLIFHENPLSDFAISRIFFLVSEELKKAPSFKVNVIHSSTLKPPMLSNSASINGMLNLSIVNPENNKIILINLSDRLEPNVTPNHGFDDFNIVQIIGGMSISESTYLKNKDFLDRTRTPLMIPVDKVSEDEYLLKCTPNNAPKIKKALFIGNVYGGRSEIAEILNKHPLFEIRHSIREEGLHFKDYIEEMQKYSLCLSLNGYAEVCYRDLEAMGAYIPVIRSKFLNSYYNEIIPDYHYIVGSEPCVDGFLRYNKPPEHIASQFIERVEKVINDQDYLNSIAQNGRKYYESSCSINAIVKNTLKFLDLDLLK